MYTPQAFEVKDPDEILAFIEANAFGQLVSTVDGRLFSTPMPFLLSDDRRRLHGHLATGNPQHRELDGQEVLITLQGPHAYISPSWYESPGVPTWNYQAVHIYGRCRLIRDTARVQGIVEALTRNYESPLENPWQPAYPPALLEAIVGFEVGLDELQCKYKLSQNRPARDRQKVMEALKETGSPALAGAMARQRAMPNE